MSIYQRLKDYFIGQLLASEEDVLKKANITLLFNIISAAITLMLMLQPVYILNRIWLQTFKGIGVCGVFLASLFIIRYTKNIRPVCHILVLVSWANVIANLYLFNGPEFFSGLITVCNILVAYHILGSREGLIYGMLHGTATLSYVVLQHWGFQIAATPTVELVFEEQLMVIILLFAIIIYLLHFYHSVYQLAKQKIRSHVEELVIAKEKAEEINKLKSNFLSNMSHEIRTPINGILGLSQIIEDETQDEHIREYVKLQQSSGNRLLNTIESILQLSKLESEHTSFSLKKVNINETIRVVIDQHQPMAKEKKVHLHHLTPDTLLECLIEESLLKQVLNHVIGNAIKFTKEGHVRVESGLNDQVVTITISDTGIGISEKFKPLVFAPFEQESSGTNRGFEGSGLGLSIAKKYMELVGGEISFSSEKGVGSTFYIRIPRDRIDSLQLDR